MQTYSTWNCVCCCHHCLKKTYTHKAIFIIVFRLQPQGRVWAVPMADLRQLKRRLEAVGVLPPGDHFAEKEVYTVDTCIYMYHKHTRTHTDTHAASIFNFAHAHTYIYIYMHSNRYHNFNHGWYVLPCACWTGRKTFYRFDLRPGSHNDHEGWRDCLTKLCSKYLGPESPQPKEVQRVIQCRG